MKTLIPNVHIIDPQSPYHDSTMDILVVDGAISAIGKQLDPQGAKRWELASGRCISPGWIDIRSQCGQPGNEERENYESLMASAAHGGFTHVALLPTTNPVRDSRPHIEALDHLVSKLPVKLLPLGSVSQGIKGVHLAEMQDMLNAGAVGFTDDIGGLNNPQVLQLALEYSSNMGVAIQSMAYDNQLSPQGQAHEGEVAVHMGLSPIPSLAEVTRIQRDLAIHTYAGGRLHIANVSSMEGVDLIRQAKAAGSTVTADVNIANLVGTESDIADFNSAYKTLPPLRSHADREALWEGLNDGTLDIIAMDHRPMDIEHVDCEWGKAAFGIASLDHAFGWFREVHSNSKALGQWIEAVCHAPRELYGLGKCVINVGAPADFTLFALDGSYDDWLTLGENRPDWSQNGRAIGTMLGNSKHSNL